MSKCAKCENVFSGEMIAVCNICNDLYHATNTSGVNCAGLSATELKVLELKRDPLLFYKCKKCISGGKKNPVIDLLTVLSSKIDSLEKVKNDFQMFEKDKLPKIESDIDKIIETSSNHSEKLQDIQGKMKKLEDEVFKFSNLKINNHNVTNVGDNSQFKSTSYKQYKEFGIREKKLNNVMIYNFPENVDSHGHYKVIVEVSKISSLLDNFGLKTKFSSKNIIRLGKYDKNKIRPIRLIMEVRSDVSKIISNWQALPRDIHVSFDLTSNQRNSYNILKNEARKFNIENKDAAIFKIVRFKEGEPIIIDKVKVNTDTQDVDHSVLSDST